MNSCAARYWLSHEPVPVHGPGAGDHWYIYMSFVSQITFKTNLYKINPVTPNFVSNINSIHKLDSLGGQDYQELKVLYILN